MSLLPLPPAKSEPGQRTPDNLRVRSPAPAGVRPHTRGRGVVHLVLLMCVGVVVATVVSLVWNFLLRPVLYTTGWVRTTAHDLEVAGWQAECDDDIPGALAKYAESLNLDPRNPALLARVDELMEAHPWVRFEWPDRPDGEKPADGA